MNGILFESDESKERANLRKHGVDFAEAATVFDDPLSVTIDDPDHSDTEDRFMIVGLSARSNLLVVVHTMRSERIRIISARPASPNERRTYEESSI